MTQNTTETSKRLLRTPEILKEKYNYLQLLGEGSNGRTWLAMSFDQKKEVAIKKLKDYDTFKQLELFIREAEVLKSIQVKGVPALYDSIFSDDGQCYLIEEYVPYPSLQSLLDTEILFDEPSVLRIMLSVASILKDLETRYTPPIIHQNIKPSNIICHFHTSKEIEAYLIDFGAVAHPEKRGGGSTIAGTFGYMAPEQYQGEANIQSDYYALGATALHLLTGISPYDMDKTVFELDFDKYLPKNTSPGMKELLHFLLAPQPAERPQNADDLIAAIDKAMHPSAVQKQTWRDKLTAWFKETFSFISKENENSISIYDKAIDIAEKIKESILRSESSAHDEWEKTTAHIERFIQDKKLIEYSYQIKGDLYCGYIPIESEMIDKLFLLATEQHKTEENICTIEYLTDIPCISENTSSSIYVSKEILDQINPAPPSDHPKHNPQAGTSLEHLIQQSKYKAKQYRSINAGSNHSHKLQIQPSSDQLDDLIEQIQSHGESPTHIIIKYLEELPEESESK